MSGPVVVTGASGFIGSALVARLRALHVEVVAVSRSPFQPGHAPGLTQVMVEDYKATPAVPAAALVHLAETSDVADAESLGEAHVNATVARLEALLQRPWRRVVYGSSMLARGVYGRAKRACELRVLEAGGAAARLTTVYGPGMPESGVVSDVLRQIPGAEPLRVRNAAARRDLLWVEDAADGLARLAASDVRGWFDLASGRTVSVDELARTALAVAGQPERPVESARNAPTDDLPEATLGRTFAALGWRAQTSLEAGLRQLIDGRA